MNELRKEIRDSLLGRIRIENGNFVVARKGLMQFQFGMQDGFGSVLVFGIQCRMMWYRIPGKRKDAEPCLRAVLNSMGRKLVLASAPKLDAVYCTSITGQPVVLTARMTEKEIEIFAYSGKGFTGWLSNKHIIRRFEKGMPEAMTPLQPEKLKARREEEKENLKSPSRLRKEKKAAEKKAAKAEKREARKNASVLAMAGNLISRSKAAANKMPVEETKPAEETKPIEEIKPIVETEPALEPRPAEVIPEEPKPIEKPVKTPFSDGNTEEKEEANETKSPQTKKNKKKKKRKH